MTKWDVSISKLKFQLHCLQCRVKVLEDSGGGGDECCVELQNQIDTLNTDLDNLTIQVNTNTSDITIIEADITAIESDITNINNDITAINNSLITSTIQGRVNTYADLPSAAANSGEYWAVTNSQGTRWLPGTVGGTYYSSGIYYSDGATWAYQGTFPYEATLTQVDAGLANDVFVTPSTFENATKWTAKQDTLVSGTNIKTVNSSSLLGSGNLAVGDALIVNPLSQFAATTSAQLAGIISDETGSGALTFATTPTFTTNITVPKVIGGTDTTSTLTLQTTSGVGTTNADMIFLVGNNGATEALRISNAANIGIGAASTGAKVELTNNALGATPASTSGLNLVNQTAATSGNQQSSPVLKLTGQGWKTNATASSQTVEFQEFVLPVQGASVATATFKLQSQVNSGGWQDALSIASTGVITVGGGSQGVSTLISTIVQSSIMQTASTATSGNLYAYGASNTISTTVSQLLFAGASTINHRITMRGTTSANPVAGASYAGLVIGTQDSTIASSGTHALFAQQVIKPLTITAGAGALTNSATLYLEAAATGATNNYNLWVAAGRTQLDGITVLGSTLRLKSYTVATLPAGVQGDTAYVTDALAPTYNATVLTGGSAVVPVFYNGTNWITY